MLYRTTFIKTNIMNKLTKKGSLMAFYLSEFQSKIYSLFTIKIIFNLKQLYCALFYNQNPTYLLLSRY